MVDLQILARPIAAEIGQRVAESRSTRTLGATHFDLPFCPQPLDQRLEHVVGQTHPVREHVAARFAVEQRLHEQLLDLVDGQTGVLEGARLRRRRQWRRSRGVRPSLNGEKIHAAYFCAIGTSTWMNLIAAGPIVTTQIAGKMQNTSGNTIFTPVLAAASSARCRRLVRTVSECTRSDCATLVPNLSV